MLPEGCLVAASDAIARPSWLWDQPLLVISRRESDEKPLSRFSSEDLASRFLNPAAHPPRGLAIEVRPFVCSLSHRT